MRKGKKGGQGERREGKREEERRERDWGAGNESQLHSFNPRQAETCWNQARAQRGRHSGTNQPRSTPQPVPLSWGGLFIQFAQAS